MPFIPPSLYPLIGANTVYWGAFEIMFDTVLSSLIGSNPRPSENGWKTRAFPKRKELFTDKFRERFPGHNRIYQFARQICADAAELHWQRNIIVHGQYYIVMPESGEVPIKVRGVNRGKEVVLDVTPEFLARTYHDVGHLTARLKLAFNPDDEHPHSLSSQDRSLLRDYIHSNPPTIPIPATL